MAPGATALGFRGRVAAEGGANQRGIGYRDGDGADGARVAGRRMALTCYPAMRNLRDDFRVLFVELKVTLIANPLTDRWLAISKGAALWTLT